MIGKRIKDRRLELGLTQEELAHKIGYKSKSTINKIELDKHDVNQTQMIKFAQALDVPVSYFIDGFEIEVVAHKPQVMNQYFSKFSALSPANQENVMKYIDFLLKEDDK